MSKLIEELKNEHTTIVRILKEVNKLGIGTKEAQQMLKGAEKGLITHLKREDEELYPFLNKHSKDSNRLEKLLFSFASEMEKITEVAINFFQKYKDGGSQMEFAKDYGRLFIALQTRIGKEELYLYPEYDKIIDE